MHKALAYIIFIIFCPQANFSFWYVQPPHPEILSLLLSMSWVCVLGKILNDCRCRWGQTDRQMSPPPTHHLSPSTVASFAGKPAVCWLLFDGQWQKSTLVITYHRRHGPCGHAQGAVVIFAQQTFKTRCSN